MGPRSPRRTGVSEIRAGKTPASAPPSTTNPVMATAMSGCHQMAAAASTAMPLPQRTTACGGTGPGSTARPIRTAVSAPQ